MSGIILYQSKYGATRRYAQWLAEKTGFALMETKKARPADVEKYDTVLLGGGIYASGIAGLSFLKKNIDAWKTKKILVFCVGASPYDEAAFRQVVQLNMKGSLAGLPCFYCRGAWDMDAMNAVDRTLCKMLQKATAKKDPGELAVWEKALAEAGNGPCDWTDRAYLRPLLDMLNT